MSSEQSKNDELVANQLRFDLKLDGEQVMNSASAKVGPPHEIKIDESHRGLSLAGVWRRLLVLYDPYRRFVGGHLWVGMVYSE
jgi:hypothetical protein